MADGFLSRWTRLKGQADKQSAPTEESKDIVASPKSDVTEKIDTIPPASLEDVEKIDRFAPDFSAFMKPDVDPVVQQAALKKMFTDPHFNTMDGLDIYIDDYSKPDPLSAGMLKRMVQSEMLNLFSKTSEESAVVKQQTGSDTPPIHSSSQVNSTPDNKIPVEPVQKKT
jgi:Protein of unknown function (DUF3306)